MDLQAVNAIAPTNKLINEKVRIRASIYQYIEERNSLLLKSWRNSMVSTSNTPQIDQEQSFLYFRVCIGGVCFVFLFVLIIGRMLFERQIAPLDAISDYYYSSSMHNVFVGGLCILAALLICYRYEQIDTVANFFAGICAIGVALFPEAPPSWYLKQHCEHLTKLEMQQCEQVTNLDKVIGYVHWAFAAFFLVTIALIVLGLFTRPHQKLPGPAKGSKHPKKYIRNRWYRWLGGLMFLCVIFCFICQVVILPHFTGAEGIKPIFCLELISLILFIAAWVIKGQALLWDDAQRSTMAGIFQYIGVSVHDAWKSFRGVFPTREQQASEAADFLASLADFIVSTKSLSEN